MKSIEQSYKIKAPLAKVWQAFIDPKVIDKWGGGPAKMVDKVGSDFSLWGGDIHGTNTKVVSQKLLEQDWFSGNEWPKPSKLSFSFESDGNSTIVNLKHTNIPDAEAKDIAGGWEDYYLGPIKEQLEQ